MQDKKQHNVEFIFDTLKKHYKLRTYRELAVFLGVKEGTLNAWKARDRIGDVDIILTKCKGLSYDWLKTGEGEMFKGVGADDGEGRAALGGYQHPNLKIQKIVEMLETMDENTQEDILLSVEKEKLLRDLLQEKRDKKAG